MPDAEAELGIIEANAHGNVINCCSSLFRVWLERQPEASWGQLIQGLKDVELHSLAAQLQRKLELSITSGHTNVNTTMYTILQIPVI